MAVANLESKILWNQDLDTSILSSMGSVGSIEEEGITTDAGRGFTLRSFFEYHLLPS